MPDAVESTEATELGLCGVEALAASAAEEGFGFVALLSVAVALVSIGSGPKGFLAGVDAAVAAAVFAASFAAFSFKISSNFPVSLILMGRTLLGVSADGVSRGRM